MTIDDPSVTRWFRVTRLLRFMLVLFVMLVACVTADAQTWRALGPPGGDVHSLAADPSHPGKLFLGTADGHIFGSEDSGQHWSLLGRAGNRRDSVVTSIIVDPRDARVLLASAWTQDLQAGGGVFRSTDAGSTWRVAGLEGEAVRVLTIAPSNPNVLVAGTLDGVYRSDDSGTSWERISPEHHEEIRNLDSIAIDPRDPRVIYAGTYHLPWKTVDGGRTWRPIHQGMIDDSDVMSLLVDRANPTRIYASACSGIYRSDNGAVQWKKIQGIPYAARRTYAITQEPQHPSTVYAATSEGLWKSSDAGVTWRRSTPGTWVINAVVADADGRVVIGTDHLGVLTSDDNGEHFQESNAGFSHRQILALASDAARPGRVMAVLANAPEAVLATGDNGATWAPLGPGLHADQMLKAYAAPDGWWATLAHGGLMRYDSELKSWRRDGVVTGEAARRMAKPGGPARPKVEPQKVRALELVVNDMAFSSTRGFAATESGLLTSVDQGHTWTLTPIGPLTDLPVQSVRVSQDGRNIWVVSLRGLVFSVDGGTAWTWHDLPDDSGGALSLDVDRADENVLIAISHKGLYISRDGGETWQPAGSGLPSTPVQDFAVSGAMFLASMRTGGLYMSSDEGRTWSRVPGALGDGFFPAVIRVVDTGTIYAASATDGLYAVEQTAPDPLIGPSK